MPLFRALAIGGVALAATGLVACSAPDPADSGPTSLSVGVPPIQFVSTFDPERSSGLHWLAGQATYDSLVRLDPHTGEYVPWLAKEFEISDDGLTVSITLRDDVDFIDGEHLDAAAYVENFEYYMDMETPRSDMAWVSVRYQPVAAATGEYTLEITTDVPVYVDSYFFADVFSRLPVVSPAAIGDTERLATESVGTGPYLVDEVVPDVSVSFVRNPDYWNPEAFPFDELEVVLFDDKVAALNAVKSGQLDAAEIEAGFADEAESAGLRVTGGQHGFMGLIVLDRNGENFPYAGDVRVRRALNHAFDRETIAEELEFGYGTPSSQPFGPNRPGEYVEGGDDRYPYDPELARELLAEAGYPDGFTLQLPDGPVAYGAIDYKPVLEQYLADIGVTVEWVGAADGSEAIYKVIDLEVPAWLLYNYYFLIPDGFNLGINQFAQRSDDPEFQELFAEYSAGTQDEHAAALPRMAEYILDQAWFVPISHPQVLWATRPEVAVTSVLHFPGLSMFEPAE